MQKKIIAGVLVLTIFMGSVALPSGVFENVAEKTGITASAYDKITSGDYKYGVLDDGTIEIAKYIGSDTTVSIPTTIGGKKVTSIGKSAFGYCMYITSITIPNGVKNIEDKAFNYCSSLTNITIPDSITSIGDEAFDYCKSLTGFNIGNNNTKFKSYNGILYNKDMTRLLCCPAGTKITSITIPNSVTSIKNRAFAYCKNLKSVIISNKLTNVQEFAFCYCTNLATITISSSVTNIGDWAFSNCEKLKSITIPSSVKSIGIHVFDDCTSLESIKVDSNNKNYSSWNGIICDKKMYNVLCCPAAKKIKSITIPSSVIIIGNQAFNKCTSIESVTILNGVISIGEDAFRDCTSLASITIPNSVTNISRCAFGNCTSLKNITIPNSVKGICDYAFFNCESLESITIPSSVTSIGKNAFGYYYSSDLSKYVTFDNFKIYCYANTAGEIYAKENNFSYELLHATVAKKNVKKASVSKIADKAYTGKAICPAVKVKYGKTALKKNTDYTVSYKYNKSIGKASVIIKGKGKYSGTKTVTFKINPKKQIAKLTSYNDAFKASWSKDKQATGYQVMYAKAKSFKSSKTYTVNAKTLSKKIKGKNKTTYYVKVRTYKTVKGTKYYGAWSTAKAVKTK